MANGIPVEIDRQTVSELLKKGARLVDVLSDEQYQLSHLAGAEHVPLKAIDGGISGRYRKDEPIIVYCNDYQ